MNKKLTLLLLFIFLTLVGCSNDNHEMTIVRFMRVRT